jgi:hypothetical protein
MASCSTSAGRARRRRDAHLLQSRPLRKRLVPLFGCGFIGAAARAPCAVAVPVAKAGVGHVLMRLRPRRLTALPGRS